MKTGWFFFLAQGIGEPSVPFGHKWTKSALGITINNPVATLMRISINLVTKQIYNPGIVKCNPWCTYSPLVPKRDTFVIIGSPMVQGLYLMTSMKQNSYDLGIDIVIIRKSLL